jgi:two-component system LytT family response regulator
VIRAVVVDDEPPARKRICDLLADEADIRVVAQCANGPEAVAAIESFRPDLLLLDAQMPEMDGFEVLRSVEGEPVPATIFVTAYDAHAVRAFEVHAVDYVLKPVDRSRFAVALQRARERLSVSSSDQAGRVSRLLHDMAARAEYLERLVVREVGRITLLPVDTIDWIEGADNYVLVHAGATAHHVRATLKSLEERLDPNRFVRVHRSAMVAVDRIRSVETTSHGDARIVLKNGTSVAASRTYDAGLRKLLEP